MDKVNIVWFRRDLRFKDNTALNAALKENLPILPLFIFDKNITSELEPEDARVTFIYESLTKLHEILKKHNSGILLKEGTPLEVFKDLQSEYKIDTVYVNRDYEPYGKNRDFEVSNLLAENNINLLDFKDQVIFEAEEVSKDNNEPYIVYSHFKKKWLNKFSIPFIDSSPINYSKHFHKNTFPFPTLKELGFVKSLIKVVDYNLNDLDNYIKSREYPALDSTSYLSPHLRFGTISIREVVVQTHRNNMFLSELIWRDFFIQIMSSFPNSITNNFKPKYNAVAWLNNQDDFKKWCDGETGYPLVDAGMKQLNKSGYMHNRVRMVTAGFLTKHLLIDWRWGEAYFAKKLLDFDLASNVGNWQWAAGTGCDAAPYFRVFNPKIQLEKFDPDYTYVKKWIPDFNKNSYIEPMVEHSFARKRAIETYKEALSKT